jgi:hypothetical protein
MCDGFVAAGACPIDGPAQLLLQSELVDVDVAGAECVGAAGQVLHVALVDLFGLDLDGFGFMCLQGLGRDSLFDRSGRSGCGRRTAGLELVRTSNHPDN